MDAWHEMVDFLLRHKLRTALTALSVAWGIFMLVLLLAAGNGLQNGVRHDFRDDAQNSIWIGASRTSLPYKGNPPGRPVKFANDDLEALQRKMPQIEHLTGRFYLWGDFFVSYKGKTARFDIRGCHPDHLYIEKTILVSGRFINHTDLERKRKVAIIGIDVQRELFADQEPLGAFINIRGVQYRVVGTYRDDGAQSELSKIYVPITTAQLVYSEPERVHHMMFTIGTSTVEQSQAMVEQSRAVLAQRHHFDPKDTRALSINNNLERFEKLNQVFEWIRVFVWAVGVGTIFAGMVSVSNIMLISVRERTVEVGVRKALGATPLSVIWMVLQEALFITSIAGYMGLLAGAMTIAAVNRYMPPNDYLRDPALSFSTALIATVLVVLAGAMAGLVPAVHAARVKPIVAMRGQ